VDLVTLRPPFRSVGRGAPALVAGAAAAGALTTVLVAASGAAGAPAAPAPPTAAARASTTPAAGHRGPACPTGALPRVTLTGATFSPPLTGGTSFVKGRYTITLVGTVDDETGAGIDVRGLRLTIGGRPWTARPTVATRVAAQTSARLAVTGTYTATRTERVDLRTKLSWRWTDAALTPCGTKGLVDDD
jgi:hypothetical protein